METLSEILGQLDLIDRTLQQIKEHNTYSFQVYLDILQDRAYARLQEESNCSNYLEQLVIQQLVISSNYLEQLVIQLIFLATMILN